MEHLTVEDLLEILIIMTEPPEETERYLREAGIDAEGARKRILALIEKLQNEHKGEDRMPEN